MPRAATDTTAARLAIAPCAFELAAPPAGSTLATVQVTPAGHFLPRDGRPLDVPSWYIDGELAAGVIARANALATPLVIDYEHQTLEAEKNGQPAPAAAWLKDLEWREGEGLFATIELTDRAAAYVRGREYRYFSPVFAYDPQGRVTALLMGALVNNPGLDGMRPVELLAAARARFATPTREEPAMEELLRALREILGLPADANQEQTLAACRALNERQAALRSAVGAQASDDLVAVCTALRTRADSAGTPDPAKFVPVATVQELQGQLASLSAQVAGREVEELVASGLADGRILPPMEGWARDLGKKDLAALKSYLGSAQPIAALKGTQTAGQPPAGDAADPNGLSADELAVCRAQGLDPVAFAKTKAEIAKA